MVEVEGNISVAGFSVLLQSGALDPVELAKTTLEKIAGYRDRAIFTDLMERRAQAKAKASAERIHSARSRGLLGGIPVAWKDMFNTEGAVTAAGSIVLSDQPPAKTDAAVVKRLPRPASSASAEPSSANSPFPVSVSVRGDA